jgi:anti-sigma factor RsiW
MNCRRFEQRLDEYADETLWPASRAAADRHLAGCAACRERVRHHRQIGQYLSATLQQATQSLRLRPDVERRVLEALPGRSRAVARQPSVAWLWLRRLRPWLAAAGLLLAGALLIRPVSHWPNRRLETDRSPNPSLAASASIEVSYQVPTYTFHREGRLVTDALTYETVVVHGRLWSQRN